MKIVLNRNLIDAEKWNKKKNIPQAVLNPTGNPIYDGKFFIKHPVNGYVEINDGDYIMTTEKGQYVITEAYFNENYTEVK